MNSLYVVVNGIVMLFIYHPFIFFSFFYYFFYFREEEENEGTERNGTEGKQLYSLRNRF